MNVRDNLIKTKELLGESINTLNKLHCECDDYNGFTCNLHSWKGRLTRLIEEINGGIEGEEE